MFGLRVGFIVTGLNTTHQQLLAFLRAGREGLSAVQLGKMNMPYYINIEA